MSWLTACFAALPPKLKKAVIDWRMQSTDAVPEITAYLSCLDFCGAVTNAGDPIVVRQLRHYLSPGLLFTTRVRRVTNVNFWVQFV